MRKINVTIEQMNNPLLEVLGCNEYFEVLVKDRDSDDVFKGAFMRNNCDDIHFCSDDGLWDGDYTHLREELGFRYSWACTNYKTANYHMDDRGYEIVSVNGTTPRRGRRVNYDFFNNLYTTGNVYTGIHGYHSGRRYNGLVKPSKTPYRIGVELEVECNSSYIKNQINANFKSNWLLMERDGSLSSNGIEFITIPMTPKSIKMRNTWMDFIDMMSSRAKSWNTRTCGLHVHIGREILGDNAEEQSETIGKLLFLYHHYIKEHPTNVKVYGRDRCYSEQDGKTSEGVAVKTLGTSVLKVRDVKDKLKKSMTERSNRDRYFDINIRNEYTIEFRKGRGSLNVDRITAVIEYSELLCLYARKVKWDKISDTGFFEFARMKVKRTSPLWRFLASEEYEG